MKKHLLSLAVFILLFPCFAFAGQGTTALRLGVLPVLDTLPLHVAVQDGLFERQNLTVELVPFASALERDTAMQAGLLDGYFGDLIATCLLVKQQVPMRIALTCYRTTPGAPMFGIAASPKHGKGKLADLRGASIGYSKSTIMEYLLDRISEQHKLSPQHFNRVEVKKIPIRLQMLLSDQIDAAILPEPLLTLVQARGGVVLATAENLNIPLTVLSLHEQYFEGPKAIYDRFLQAYREAVHSLAEHPEKYQGLMAQKCRIPKPLAASYPVYAYPEPALPSIDELNAVQDWMVAHSLLESPVAPKRLLPKEAH